MYQMILKDEFDPNFVKLISFTNESDRDLFLSKVDEFNEKAKMNNEKLSGAGMELLLAAYVKDYEIRDLQAVEVVQR